MKQVYLGPRLRGDDDEVTFRGDDDEVTFRGDDDEVTFRGDNDEVTFRGDDETVTPRRIFMLGGRRTRAMTRWADEGPRLPLLTPT